MKISLLFSEKCLSLPPSKSKRYEAFNRGAKVRNFRDVANEFSKAKIASAIGVHKSTISRELQRNKDEKSGIYDWATAYSLQSRTILGKGEPTRIPMACTGSTFQEELIFFEWC